MNDFDNKFIVGCPAIHVTVFFKAEFVKISLEHYMTTIC